MVSSQLVHFIRRSKEPQPSIDWQSQTKIERLQVILKTVERCNLACDYCYYFFGGDETYRDRPAVIRLGTVSALSTFLRRGADALQLREVNVVFHGGEPMLQKRGSFDAACQMLRDAFAGAKTNLTLAIQTNGTLVTDDWIKLFHKHHVGVGVSIDGPEAMNDLHRFDHRGKGSYSAAAEGIRKLLAQEREGENSLGVGGLSVLNPAFDYREVFRHLADDLNLRIFNFLLPDHSHDNSPFSALDITKVGQRLCEIFEEWITHKNVTVRMVDEVLSFFQVRQVTLKRVSMAEGERVNSASIPNQILVVQSDGTMSIDDSLIPATTWRSATTRGTIFQDPLDEFLGQSPFQEIHRARHTLPEGCSECGWKRLCRGGDLENRFSNARGFDNPSIYCEALKTFYSRVTQYLIEAGYPSKLITEKLQLDAHA